MQNQFIIMSFTLPKQNQRQRVTYQRSKRRLCNMVQVQFYTGQNLKTCPNQRHFVTQNLSYVIDDGLACADRQKDELKALNTYYKQVRVRALRWILTWAYNATVNGEQQWLQKPQKIIFLKNIFSNCHLMALVALTDKKRELKTLNPYYHLSSEFSSIEIDTDVYF